MCWSLLTPLQTVIFLWVQGKIRPVSAKKLKSKDPLPNSLKMYASCLIGPKMCQRSHTEPQSQKSLAREPQRQTSVWRAETNSAGSPKEKPCVYVCVCGCVVVEFVMAAQNGMTDKFPGTCSHNRSKGFKAQTKIWGRPLCMAVQERQQKLYELRNAFVVPMHYETYSLFLQGRDVTWKTFSCRPRVSARPNQETSHTVNYLN